MAQAIAKDGKDCCSKNGISFALDERCYALECSGAKPCSIHSVCVCVRVCVNVSILSV